MRRAAVVLATCLCAIAGCRGGAAQEPYHGVAAAQPRAVEASAAPAGAAGAELIASEVDVPWAIALLSDEPRRLPKHPRPVIVVEREAVDDNPASEEIEREVVVVDHAHADEKRTAEEKPASPKTCTGVVNRRS